MVMIDPKKGKYTEEENEQIIEAINKGLQEGKREREILKELSEKLNRGYAGIMSHVRKLRSEYPDRFVSLDDSSSTHRLNSWEPHEEELVIDTVNAYTEEGKSLSAAIAELEKKLNRTQGAIYQRIYTLRRKHPEKFKYLPPQRPRRRRKLPDWQINLPVIHNLEETSHYPNSSSEELSTAVQNQLATATNHIQTPPAPYPTWSPSSPTTNEEEIVFKAFEERYCKPNQETKQKLMQLMRQYGCTRVSVALLTLADDKEFSTLIVDFLAKRLQNDKII
ncbi:hypothetical protein [Thermoflavimicrobium dichotomicum]|uniref:Uncharacterized protein n=1 Tax=Thermoflavimicrobium dichotomicum TaxID=46223 RepID=A0A1I3MQI3_9BACL|nr:hypothetical protein [Thermoflavimicrobium dichotomicum]SFI99202.1 hypothetical protein SAMN05421852_103160 [Thermoflavimicrobium dichotomicum]